MNQSGEVADDLGEILRSKNYFESVTKLVGQKSNLVQESGMKPKGGSTRRDELTTIRLFSPKKGAISRGTVLDVEEGVAPLSITHTDTELTVEVSTVGFAR